MKQAVIENPVLNSPFREPSQHFVLEGREGITGEIAPGRRVSEYFIPIPRPKKRNAQLVIETIEQREENRLINQIRQRVGIWRQGKYPGITRVSSRLLEYWTNPEREKPLFFCQIEALETAIYLLEAAEKYGDRWILDELQAKNEEANPGLFRIAFKMATGSGKTVVMAMLIAWQTLNKLADRQNKLFSDAFLVITPGITIRDRLRVLMPNDPENYYRQRDLLPPHQLDELKKATIVLTNYHAFQLREKYQASKLARQISGMEATGAGKESPAEMVRRVCRGLGGKKGIVVINDEAHHCYRRRAETEEERLEREEKQEADKRNEAARVWISGIEAVQRKLGIRDIYDLSATPFFLRGSGYREGDLFGWVVSDFALIDAIESGIVKVPRVPVADNAMTDVLPTYRNLWEHIREDLPRKGRKTEAVSGAPKLPAELQGALHSLYGHYENTYRQWEASSTRTQAQTPPVFIVVCNNTNVSKLVYDYIAGWEKEIDGKTVVQAGRLDIFRNDDGQGGWLHRPNTILIDSEQLDSGEAMSDEFKKVAAREIDEFKQDYRLRFPEKDVNQIKDEDLLREVMNTVGKTGKLGEQVKCVVSVSMLTEGWDANTVTHILGVRAFGTQLLCEQVVGRSLRRRSYEPGADGLFEPEYAEVFGVPFSFLPCAGTNGASPPPKKVWRVRALPERAGARISFPRLTGYRYALPVDRLTAAFSEDSRYVLTTQELATWTESAPIVGEHSYTSLGDLRKEREQTVAFEIARLTLEKYFLDAEGGQQVHLFADLLGIAREWLRDQVRCHDNTFKQL
ncbi:MAG: DEAD/DEAH box helicase family protein, partial [Candidatus Hydrogenedentes bacterium]|nr:DEAD/DEAH box helicase family protein [Candidatus Hydrogenedentota bacterium]